MIKIPRDLHVAIKQFCDDHSCQMTDLLDISLRKFTTLWQMNEKIIEEKEKNLLSEFSEGIKTLNDLDLYDEIGNILIENPPPKSDGDDYPFHVRFSENESFRIACEAERMAFVRSTQDFIKRVLSWYLRNKGYLHDKREDS